MRHLYRLVLVSTLILFGCQKQVDINEIQISDISGEERVDFVDFLKGVDDSFLLTTVRNDDKPYFLYNGEVYSGQIVHNLLDGTLIKNYRVENGLLDGLNQEFDNNGNLLVKINFSDGYGNGPFELYHENGQLFEEGSLSENKLEGGYKLFFETGTLRAKGSYENNQRVGVWEFYDESESLIQNETYVSGVKQGKAEYFTDNILVKEENYQDGELHGEVKIYDQNGDLSEERVYENGYRVDLRVVNIVGTDDLKFEIEENQRGVNTLGRSRNGYVVRSIEVSPNEEISIEMTTKSDMPSSAMSHNFVIVSKGTDLDQFARSSISHRGNDYIAPEYESEIIANTKMLGSSESDLITVKAPDETGEYDIICTFPGHYAGGMVAKLLVR